MRHHVQFCSPPPAARRGRLCPAGADPAGRSARPAAGRGRADDPGQARRDRRPRRPAARRSQKWDVSARHGPGHDVPIDVTQGTWMNLDVSPDGREIAFDLLGDIYVVPIAGGEARPLATGNAWDMQPRYSPNGREIAFTSDRGGGDNIWVMNRDGSDPARDHQGNLPPAQRARLDARRQLHRRAQAFHLGALARRRRDVALPSQRRRRRRADDQGADQAEGHQRAGLLARRPLPLFLRRRDARRDFPVQQGRQRPDLRDPAPRPRRPARSSRTSPAPAARSARRPRPMARASPSSAASAASPT